MNNRRKIAERRMRLYRHPSLPTHWVLEGEDGGLWTVDTDGRTRRPYTGTRKQLEGQALSPGILRLLVTPQLVNATEIARRVGKLGWRGACFPLAGAPRGLPRAACAGQPVTLPTVVVAGHTRVVHAEMARPSAGAANEATMATVSSALSLPLPIDTGNNTDADFETLGFQFGDPLPHRPRFRVATLPDRWSITGGSHPSVSEIVDERGLVRVSVAVIERLEGHVDAYMFIVDMPAQLARAAVLDGHPIPWEVLTGPEPNASRCVGCWLSLLSRPGQAVRRRPPTRQRRCSPWRLRHFRTTPTAARHQGVGGRG